MSITPVYLLIKTLDFPCYAGLPYEMKGSRIELEVRALNPVSVAEFTISRYPLEAT
jgi:hypothetical protein